MYASNSTVRLLFLLACAGTASAQTTTFSIDSHGPTFGSVAAGDVLAPDPTTVPRVPINPGPLPIPQVLVTDDTTTGLGVPGGEVDALSHGFDGPIDQNIFIPGTNLYAKAHYHFSVDEFAVGEPYATDVWPNVVSEGGATGDAAADVFTDLGFQTPPPLGPFAGGTPANQAWIDGNGRRSDLSLFAYGGTGLVEPTAPGCSPNTGDNLDALDIDPISAAGTTGFPIWFSLDAGFVDPRTGCLNADTAAANGFVGGDVLVTNAPGGPPTLFAPAASLGLDNFGTGTDDLDALILWENGTGFYEVSNSPYMWTASPPTDQLLFSVREGSAVIGQPDSWFGIPIEPGDILMPPLDPALGGLSPHPAIFVAAENLGLAVSFARLGSQVFGDDIDALDFRRNKTLLAQEYCYGDGGIISGCTDCPCGNNQAPGTQRGCLNSAGQGARLETSGFACVTNDTLRFEMTGAIPSSFAILLAATQRLPLSGPCPPGSGIAQPTLLDGLRCIGGNLKRIGARATDANGDIGITNNGWGSPSPPAIGILASCGFLVCETWQFQVFYREDPATMCNNGVNTSSAAQVTILP